MVTPIKFGTDGWRAVIAEEFTFDNVVLVTKAVAGYIKTKYGSDKPVLIGYDTRFLADKFAQRAVATLNNLGFNVKITDKDVPTPVLAYAAKELNTAGALMFTASHNPPEYCGIKYIPNYAGPATTEITDIIVNNVKKLQNGEEICVSSQNKGKTTVFDPKESYFNWIKTLINFEKIKNSNIKIFYDPIYACGRGYFDEILLQFGCDVTSIHNYRDPLYGGNMPEPKEKYLPELKELVKNNYPSLGFSTDGDADRFGVFDENGNFVTPNEIIAILFKHLIKNKGCKGSVVKTVAASQMIDKIAKLYGDIAVIETPVGFKWIGQVMRDEEVIIGGEESGGLSIGGHIPEKDGILANLLILEAVAYEGKPLFQIVEDLKNEIGVHFINERIDLNLTDSLKQSAMKMFLENPPGKLGDLKITRITKLDGVKYYFEDGKSWMLIRPSGTEPLLRIYFESDLPQKIKEFTADTKKLIDAL